MCKSAICFKRKVINKLLLGDNSLSRYLPAECWFTQAENWKWTENDIVSASELKSALNLINNNLLIFINQEVHYFFLTFALVP